MNQGNKKQEGELMKKALMLLMVLGMLMVTSFAYAGITATATADNEFWVWTSGGEAGGAWAQASWNETGNNWNISNTLTGSVAAGVPIDLYVAVRNRFENISTGNPAGFLGQLVTSSGTFTQTGTNKLLTDTINWKIVTTNAWTDATELNANVGNPTALVGWGAPIAYGDNSGDSNVWSDISGIDGDAQWLWTANNSGTFNAMDNYAVLHTQVTVTPEPASMLLFGVGGLAMSMLRKKKKVA